MLFQEHYETFRDFIFFTAWREKYNRNLPEGSAVDTFPSNGFLERLSLDDVRMIATIFHIGAMSGGEGDFNSKEELYQHYHSELVGRLGDSKSAYVDFLHSWSGTMTDEFMFGRGLEELEVGMDITCSRAFRDEEN